MKLFELPYDTLAISIGRFFDYNSTRIVANTCKRSLLAYYPLALSYNSNKHDDNLLITKQLTFAIDHSDEIFKDEPFRQKVYNKLQHSLCQFNITANIKCLRYLLLTILHRHYNLGSDDINKKYEQLFWLHLQFIEKKNSIIYKSMYAKKFNLTVNSENLEDKSWQQNYYLKSDLILYQTYCLNQDITFQIQNKIDNLIGIIEKDKNDHYHLNGTASFMRLTLLLHTHKNHCKVNFLPLLNILKENKINLNLVDIILQCLIYNNEEHLFQFNILDLILTKIIKYSKIYRYEGYFKEEFKKIVETILGITRAIIPKLEIETLENIFIKIAGLSIFTTTHAIVKNFIGTYFDINRIINKEFIEKLRIILLGNEEPLILGAYALQQLYPLQINLDIAIFIEWLIQKISIIQPAANLRLLISHKNFISHDQKIILYTRLKQEISENNYHRDEDIEWGFRQNVILSHQLRTSTYIPHTSVITLLWIIQDELNKSQCLEIMKIIMSVAYGTYFMGDTNTDFSLDSEVLTYLCSKLSAEEKFNIAANVFTKKANLFERSIRNELEKAIPNCLYYLIDSEVYYLSMKVDENYSLPRILEVLTFLDINKLNIDIIHNICESLIKILQISMTQKCFSGFNPHYTALIFLLEKFFNNKQKLIVRDYIIKNLNSFPSSSDNKNDLINIFILMQNNLNNIEFINIVIKYMECESYNRRDRLSFVIKNLPIFLSHPGHNAQIWLEPLLERLKIDNYWSIKSATEIITALLALNYIEMDDKLLCELEAGINNLLKYEVRDYNYGCLLPIAAQYYPPHDLINWIKIILHKTTYPKDPNSLSEDDEIEKYIKRNLLDIKFSADQLFVFMNNSHIQIRNLGYYYIGMRTPKLSEHHLIKFYEHLLSVIDQTNDLPVFIISILAYYQAPAHYQLTSTIVMKLFLDNSDEHQNKLISTYNFCKLIKPLLNVFDDTQKSILFKKIHLFIRTNAQAHHDNINLLSNLADLLDKNPLDPDLNNDSISFVL